MSIPIFFKSQDERYDASDATTCSAILLTLARNDLAISSIVPKPWGMEANIEQVAAVAFMRVFFGNINLPVSVTSMPYGPKILAIGGGHRLSWHVHARKDAFLRVVHGHVGVILSSTDVEPHSQSFVHRGAHMHIPPHRRHRLSSPSGWAIIAEISSNVDPANPSDDNDERRISDDYGRA